MFETTITRNGLPACRIQFHTRKAAEEFANDFVTGELGFGATGGDLGDWADMTLYYGSRDVFATVVTRKA